MMLVDMREGDYAAVEKSLLDRWGVWNGENWAHGFKTEKEAIRFAKRAGGTRIAFRKNIHGKLHYVSAQKIELEKEKSDDK